MNSRWLIIADDLTGAADCGIAYAKRGLESVVAWDRHREAAGVPVLSVDSGTRSLPPEQAAKGSLKYWLPITTPAWLSIKKSIQLSGASQRQNWLVFWLLRPLSPMATLGSRL